MNQENSGVSVRSGSSDLRDGVQTHLETQKLHTYQGSKGITFGAPQPRRRGGGEEEGGESGTLTPRLFHSNIPLEGAPLFPLLTPGDKPYLSQVALTERQSTRYSRFRSQLPGNPQHFFSPRPPPAAPQTLTPHLSLGPLPLDSIGLYGDLKPQLPLARSI